jgi:hypothetical protein
MANYGRSLRDKADRISLPERHEAGAFAWPSEFVTAYHVLCWSYWMKHQRCLAVCSYVVLGRFDEA